MPDTSTRPLRICMACGGVDDHPRHSIGVAAIDGVPHPQAVPTDEFMAALPDGTPVSAIVHILNPTQISRHLDCCAAAGCEICQDTEKITGGLRGQALTDAIVTDGVLANYEPADGLSNKGLGIDG